MIEKNDIIYIYADGATRNNQSKENIGAWASVMRFNGGEKIFCDIEHNTTNNRMELYSAISGLNQIKKNNYKIFVTMDSQYVVDGYNIWSLEWRKNGWKKSDGKPIENQALWETLITTISQFQNGIWFVKCEGHSNNEGHNKADLVCNIAMDKFNEGHKTSGDLLKSVREEYVKRV